MKRLIGTLVFVLCIAIISSTAFATGTTTYRLDDLEMSVNCPDDYTVITRKTDSTDPSLIEWGLTKDYIDNLFSERSIYFDAWDDDVSNEIIITMFDSQIDNYSVFSDTELSVIASGMISDFEDMGLTWIKSEVYNHSQAKFIKIYASLPSADSTLYMLQYSTIYDSRAINVTLRSSTGQINPSQESLLKRIVDSIVFDNDPIPNASSISTAAFIYTDTKTGTQFTVPDNWSESDLNKEREYISAKFTSNLEEGLTILYGSTDVWNELTVIEKKAYSRSDYDNSLFTVSDIADSIGTNSKDVEKVTYGGKEYFKATITTSQEAYGTSFDITVTYLVRIENGYLYNYQFAATDKSPYYKDFVTLVSSAKYPAINEKSSQAVPENQPKDASTSYKQAMDSWIVLFLINLVLTLIIHPVPIWIYRYAIRKKPVEPKKAKRIVIIDAIIVALIMLVITSVTGGGHLSMFAILVWSRICYSSLTKGYTAVIDLDLNSETISQTGYIMPPPETDHAQHESRITERSLSNENELNNAQTCGFEYRIYCRNCGAELKAISKFCHKCGTKVEGRRD